jgi:hypothetical protein
MSLQFMKFRCVDQVLAFGNHQIADFRSRSTNATRKRRLIVKQAPNNGPALLFHSPPLEDMQGFLWIVSRGRYILDSKQICFVFATSIKSVRGNRTQHARQLFDSGAKRGYPFR